MNGNIIENEIDYSDLDVEFASFPSRNKIIFAFGEYYEGSIHHR